MITATCIALPEKAQNPADVLKLTLKLDKRVIRLGDSIKGTFNVTNASDKTVRVVKYGALYLAFGFASNPITFSAWQKNTSRSFLYQKSAAMT